jgi:hypothetical protein
VEFWQKKTTSLLRQERFRMEFDGIVERRMLVVAPAGASHVEEIHLDLVFEPRS